MEISPVEIEEYKGYRERAISANVSIKGIPKNTWDLIKRERLRHPLNVPGANKEKGAGFPAPFIVSAMAEFVK